MSVCPSVRPSVCPSVRMNAKISETIQATILGLGVQIPEIPAQRKFVSAEWHAHSNAHKPPKTVALTVLTLCITTTTTKFLRSTTLKI